MLKNGMKRLISFFALVIISSCGYCPSPGTEDLNLIGNWIPDANSIKYIKSKGYSNTSVKILIEHDNSIEIENMPSMWRTEFGRPNGKYENIKGAWSISSLGEDYLLIIDVKTVNGEPLQFSYLGCNICGNRNDPSIEIYIGDPDERNVLKFIKST